MAKKTTSKGTSTSSKKTLNEGRTVNVKVKPAPKKK